MPLRRFLPLVPLACLTACPPAEEPAPEDLTSLPTPDLSASQDLSSPTEVKKVGGFQVPESAYWHAPTNSWYVSNMALSDFSMLTAKDKVGWISRLDADGNVVEQRWVEAELSTPAGIRSHGDSLIVCNIDELVIISISDRSKIRRVSVPGAMLLNDVAVSLDGTAYMTDSFSNSVWRYRLDGAGALPQRVIQDAKLNVPNGIAWIPGFGPMAESLLVASTGPFDKPMEQGRLWRLILGATPSLMETQAVGKWDGVEIDLQALTVLLSDNPSATVYRGSIAAGMSMGGTLRDFRADGLRTAGDIGYDPQRRLLAVPDLVGNQVAFYTVPR